MNYAGCCQCGNRDSIKIVNRNVTNDADEEHEELITFQHICSGCNHQIANHEHLFWIEGDYQIYEMQCLLCGHGEDQRSIMPLDPRGPKD